MEYLERRIIFNLVQFIFNNYISEEHKKLLLFKYDNKKQFKEALDELLIDVFCVYQDDPKKLKYYLKFLSNKYLYNKDYLTIKQEILNRLELNINNGDVSLDDNHCDIIKTLLFVCDALNKNNIDYYVVGAIPVYIKLGLPFLRFHSDIDILINGNDIDKLQDIFRNSDFYFLDNRHNSQKFFDYKEGRSRGGHEIIAQKKDSAFSIGFFEFKRFLDGTITKRDYFSEIVDDKCINKVCEYRYSKEFVDYYYSKDKITYNGVGFRYCTIEGVYLLKKHNCNNVGRNKDLYDIKIFEQNYNFDIELLKQMEKFIHEAYEYVIIKDVSID